jgi:hypothetical protein
MIHVNPFINSMDLLGCLMLLRIQGGKMPFGVQCKFVFLPCFMIHEILLSLSAHSLISDATA